MKQSITQLAIKSDIGAYCRSYRVYHLGMTLVEFADEFNANYKSVSNFENGRSSSMFYLLMYMQLIPDNGSKLAFIQGINELVDFNIKHENDMRGVYHG